MEAVISLMKMKSTDNSVVIIPKGNAIKRFDLNIAVSKLEALEKALKEKDYKAVINLRGK